jgi:hypothetical protein
MTKFDPAVLVLLAVLCVGCNQVETADPRAGVPADQKPTAVQNATPGTATPALVTPDGEPVNAMGAATLEFHKRIEAYLKIHNEAESKVPNLRRTDDPVEISAREKALGEMIMTLRAGVQPGEIFAKEYQPFFIKIVQDDFATRSRADRIALINELPKNIKVDINTVYPTTLPLETFPGRLLRKLPDLPPELEYRIVGRSMILRDVKANLIVDILRDVVPTIPT